MNGISCFVIYFIICILTISNINCGQQLKYNISSIGNCDIPKEKYVPKPVQLFATIATIRNKQILKLNFTVHEKSLPVLNTIRGYKLVQKKKQLDYTFANLTCTNSIASIVWKKLRLRYDENCCLLPGVTVVKDLSLDGLIGKQHKAGTWDVDHSLYDFQFHTKRGVLLCIFIQIDML